MQYVLETPWGWGGMVSDDLASHVIDMILYL